MEERYFELVILSILSVVSCVVSQTLNDAKTLQTDLFNGYKKGVLPASNQSQPIRISVLYFLMSINSVKEVDETISVSTGVGLNWTDPSLTWDPSAYGNISSTIIDPIEIWIPPVFTINSADALEPIGDDIKFYTTIVATGQVFYTIGGIMNAKCPIDISKFPFDTQTCELRLGPWGITTANLVFDALEDDANLAFFTPMSDWTLQNDKVSVIDFNGYSIVILTLTIKRQSLYYGVMVIMPTLLFSFLNPLVFLLPVESGERVSLAMTILLSYAIFLTLVSASIPTTSNPMCVLLIIMIAIIAVSGVIVVGAIISAKFYYQDDEVKRGKIMKLFIKLDQKRDDKVVPIDDKKGRIVTGKDISRLIDSIFLYGSYVAIIVTVVGYFMYAAL